MPEVGFTNLLVVTLIALLAPLTPGLRPAAADAGRRARDRRRRRRRAQRARLGRGRRAWSRSWRCSGSPSCCSWPVSRSTCTGCAAACCGSRCSGTSSRWCSASAVGGGARRGRLGQQPGADGGRPLGHLARAWSCRCSRTPARLDGALGQTVVAAASVADFAAIVLLSLFFSTSESGTGTRVALLRAVRGAGRRDRRSPPSRSARSTSVSAGRDPAAGHHGGDPGPGRGAAARRLRRAGRAARPRDDPRRLPGRRRRRSGRQGHLVAPALPDQARGTRLRLPHPGVLRRRAGCGWTSTGLIDEPSALARVPVLAVALLVVRGVPALLLARQHDRRSVAAAGTAPGDLAAVPGHRQPDRGGHRDDEPAPRRPRSCAPACSRWSPTPLSRWACCGRWATPLRSSGARPAPHPRRS